MTVYVAAQGPLWRSGGDRGLYKTTDGGKTWERILEIDEHTGVSDLAFDPREPRRDLRGRVPAAAHVWPPWSTAAPARVCTRRPTAARPGRNSESGSAGRRHVGKIGHRGLAAAARRRLRE